MNYEELGAIAKQSRFVAVVSFLLFTGTVTFALRSFRVVLALCGSLAISLLWSNGVAALTVGNLNTISAAFNVLIVGLGGEFGIHFAMRYIELVSKGRPRHQALVETAETVGESLLSSAGTTSIGFFIFLLTDFKGVAQLGLIFADQGRSVEAGKARGTAGLLLPTESKRHIAESQAHVCRLHIAVEGALVVRRGRPELPPGRELQVDALAQGGEHFVGEGERPLRPFDDGEDVRREGEHVVEHLCLGNRPPLFERALGVAARTDRVAASEADQGADKTCL